MVRRQLSYNVIVFDGFVIMKLVITVDNFANIDPMCVDIDANWIWQSQSVFVVENLTSSKAKKWVNTLIPRQIWASIERPSRPSPTMRSYIRNVEAVADNTEIQYNGKFELQGKRGWVRV